MATRWLYTQFGDAAGMGGRQMGILPLQDAAGGAIAGGGGDGGVGRSGDGGEEKDEATRQELESLREMIRENAAQMKAILESQRSQPTGGNNDDDGGGAEDSTKRHIQSLVDAQSAAQKTSKEMADQTDAQIQTLMGIQARSQKENQALREQNAELLEELRQRQEEERPSAQSFSCTHNVHPKSREIDWEVVGYDYGRDAEAKRGAAMKKI